MQYSPEINSLDGRGVEENADGGGEGVGAKVLVELDTDHAAVAVSRDDLSEDGADV